MFNPEQIQAINHIEGNCNVIACAGSGKTAVIINRILNLIQNIGISPSNILAITFSKQSKDIIKSRLAMSIGIDVAKRINIETFHSFSYKLIRKTGQNPSILSDVQKKKILSDIICGDMNLYKHYEDIDFPEIMSFISHQKNLLLLPTQEEKIEGSLVLPFDKKTMVEIYSRYEAARKRDGVLDFEDMIIDAYYLLREDPALLRYCNKTYQYILIDEMQDINPAQYELIRTINETNNNLFVVGDALQNIYEWRDSCSDYLLNFSDLWPGAATISLYRNYRSSKSIVDMANYLVDGLKETRHKHYLPSISESDSVEETAYWELFKDEYEEAEAIATFINHLTNLTGQRSYSDFAILTRTNSQLLLFENELYKHGIPFENISDTLFFENKEIDLVINYLKLAINVDNNEAFLKVYNKPNRWIGKALFGKIEDSAKKNKQSLYKGMLSLNKSLPKENKNVLKLQETVEMLQDEKIPLPKRINKLRFLSNINRVTAKDAAEASNSIEKLENLDRLEDLSSQFSRTIDFLEHIKSLINFEKTSEGPAVSLSTLHKAKGTEFNSVIIPGLSEGLIPHKRTINIEEEHRLLYVGITRARNELFASSVLNYGGQTMKVSRFATLLFQEEVSKALAERMDYIPFTSGALGGLIEK